MEEESKVLLIVLGVMLIMFAAVIFIKGDFDLGRVPAEVSTEQSTQ